MHRTRSVTHSSLTNRLEHGEHKGYQPNQYDPVTGLTNPATKGYVRVRSWRHPQSVSGPGGLLAHLKPFTGHSIRGVWLDNPRRYVVFSYSTMIAEYVPSTSLLEHPTVFLDYNLYMDKVTAENEPTPKLYLDDSYYGQITRQHQGMVNAWLGQAIPEAMGIAPELDS